MATAGSTVADGTEVTVSVAPTTVKPSSVTAKRPQVAKSKTTAVASRGKQSAREQQLDGGEEREVERGRERDSQPRNGGDVRDSSDRPGRLHDGEALIDEQRRGVDVGDQHRGVREESVGERRNQHCNSRMTRS
ncbi:unnamed protein product [Phytophthora fragariaefolia]|uniref:Unnamed protein product n=1 Tax=Phytophthora fragariaefolia TaxID=1490495 RepID=A0A9W6XJV0_9STRA|nr:unnamed protein product [Phytophthora fragariaefolia]